MSESDFERYLTMRKIGKLVTLAVIVVGLLAGSEAAASAAPAAQTDKLSALVRSYSDCDGVDVVKVGNLGTSLLRNLIRASVMEDIGDPDARAILGLIRDIKGITIMDYEGAPKRVKDAINAEIGAIYSKKENLLMEVKDEGDKMYIFAASDAKGADLKDLVLYTPTDGAIIWIKGKISAEAIARLAR